LTSFFIPHTAYDAAMNLSLRDRNRRWMWLAGERAFGLDSILKQKDSAPPASAVRQASSPDLAAARTENSSNARARPTTDAKYHQPLPAKAAPAIAFAEFDSQPFSAPRLTPDQKAIALSLLDTTEVRGCTKCRLSQTRTNTVFGEGDPSADIFFIGEGPGENEDLQGRPFVGRAGELLNKMIQGMGLKRQQVFIANIVKCRPPQNRVPAPDEVQTCTPYLVRQLEIIRPKVIVTLGLPSAKYMLNTKMPMGRLRGQWHDWRGIKLMPTFHPAYLLRAYTDENRAMVWSDLRQVMAQVGLAAPARSARQ
jgi:DNA polymerase